MKASAVAAKQLAGRYATTRPGRMLRRELEHRSGVASATAKGSMGLPRRGAKLLPRLVENTR